MGQRIEWVMHVWGKKRDTLELNWIEKYHIDILKTLQEQQKRFDKILVNIALDDINDMNLFNFFFFFFLKAITSDNVEFKYCQNDPGFSEYLTFRPYVFDRIGEDVLIFFFFFKGYASHITIYRESFPMRVIDLNEMFWAYIMYQYSMNIDDVLDKLKDRCTYSWFVLKSSGDEQNVGYYNDYSTFLQKGDERFKGYIEDDLHKHSPGSFNWYNMKNIGKSLDNKSLVTSVTTEYLVENSELKKANLCTHFCEAYLMQFLKDNECYSVNDFNEAVKEMLGTLYTAAYTSKKIGREYLKEFEKYLIDNGLI